MRLHWLILLLTAATSCSSQLDGPVPEVTGVTPDLICTAQADQTITISGSGFSPAVVDGLRDSRQVVMPRVFVVSGNGTETEIPPENVSLPDGDTSGEALEVVVPQGLVAPSAAGEGESVYDIRVVNPNENEGALSGALTIVPPPEIASIAPTSGPQGREVDVTLTGSGFRDGMTVTLEADPAVAGTGVEVTSSTEASATFDLTGVEPGTYDVTVTNPDGCSFTLSGAFTVFEPDEFDLTGIDPPFGCTCEETTVTISSNGGFVSTPRVEMVPSGQSSPVMEFKREAFIDADTITAVVPAGAPLGTYDVTVFNPPSDGGIATLEGAFRVVESEVPTIEAIVPSRAAPEDPDADVTIFGENFRADVRVELIDRNGDVAAEVDNVSTVNAEGTEIDVTLPTNGMAEDAYLVRVTNLDEETFSTFSSFLVAGTGEEGNLHAFTNETSLITGRRMLAGTSAKDTAGNRYFYAIGGDTGAGGDVLQSIEVSQLSKFGQLSPWQGAGNTLDAHRVGAAAVAVPIFDDAVSRFTPIKTYLYVLGGMDDQGDVLASIERAVVLSPDDAPEITSIGASSEAGSLEAGTWYYKVSAVLHPDDPDNGGGETLPSDEAILTLGSTGAIDLEWDKVTVNGMDAVAYRIYRTDEPNGVSQTEHLIATVDDGSTTYTDTGEAPGTISPLPPGATGVWEQAGSLGTARWGHQAAVVSDEEGDRFLYVLGGHDATDGYLASVEYAAVDAENGSLGAFGTENTSPLPTARAFFSLAVETPDKVADLGGGARFFALGGVVDTPDLNGNQATELFEFSDLTTSGGNGGWTSYADGCNTDGGQCVGEILTRGGPMAIITSEKLFVMGGAETVENDTQFMDPRRVNNRDVSFDPDGDDGTIGGPIQDAESDLISPRALGVVLTGSGFIYLVGGTSDGSNALASTEKTF